MGSHLELLAFAECLLSHDGGGTAGWFGEGEGGIACRGWATLQRRKEERGRGQTERSWATRPRAGEAAEAAEEGSSGCDAVIRALSN